MGLERPLLHRIANARGCGLVATLAALAAVGASVTAALLAPPASAGMCDATATQPFLPWLDPARYVLAPGGAIETGTKNWRLSGGAQIVPGNEPYQVHDLADDESLSLPPGSTALTDRVCLGLTYPTIRFFALNSGSPLATLKVEVLFRDGLGALLGRATIATLTAFPEWQPTLPIAVLANATALAGTRSVQFRFTPDGAQGAWQIDDLYVDPWVSR